MIGKTISHYRILAKLGEGGMGVVYKALNLKLDTHVALKFLSPHLVAQEHARMRFVSEAKTASSLEHPNICVVHDIDETDDGRMFIVMPCYEGETLQARIESGPLALDDALDIVSAVASGLTKAHQKGITHRDIKPSNIFITEDGVPKIVDFGLAKFTGQTKITRTGTTVGTVAYMSPEQVRGEDVDSRSDVYAVVDRTPRVYPWLNEPGGGILPGWRSSRQRIASIACSIT
jgi:serine/threonine-protein kinase